MGNRKIFNSIAEIYANEWDDSLKEKNNIKKILKFIDLKKGDKVLEPGCGKGDFSIFLLKKIGKNGKLYAIDISEKMLVYAKAKLKKYKNVKILNCDAKKIKVKKEYFDKIICFNCFPHFYPKRKYIAEFYRLLKKGGHLIITHSLTRKNINNLHRKYGFDMRKHYLPSLQEMNALLNKLNFKICKKQDKGFYFLKVKKI